MAFTWPLVSAAVDDDIVIFMLERSHRAIARAYGMSSCRSLLCLRAGRLGPSEPASAL